MENNMVVLAFWNSRRKEDPTLPESLPEVWSFGATAEQADSLLALILDGVKTGTASLLWDYESVGDPIPTVGELSVILNGAKEPKALIRTTSVDIRPFNEVDEDHAYSEGEGDRTLMDWRISHEQFWRKYPENPRGFEVDMPVICERFELVYPQQHDGN